MAPVPIGQQSPQQPPTPQQSVVTQTQGAAQPAGLSPKDFIGSKYSTYTIGVSFYADRVAHLYGAGQGEKWYDATWEFDANAGRILVTWTAGKETYEFDANDTTQLIYKDSQGGGIIVPRIRPPI